MLRSLSTSRAVCVVIVALALAPVAGCGTKARAVVKGKVTFGGAPLKAGEVTFFTSDHRVGTAPIVDGKYEMKDAPVGDVKITVTIPPPSPVGAVGVARPKELGGMPTDMIPEAGDKTAGGKATPIPEKYKDVKTTDLTYTVEKGEHEYDIPLKP
jgi:hypothetical protein